MTKTSREQVLLRSLEDSLNTLSEFHGHVSLSNLRTQIEAKRKGLSFALWLLSFVRKSKFGIIFVFSVVLFAYPKSWFSRKKTKVYAVSLTPNNDRAFSRIRSLDPTIEALFQENSAAMPFRDRVKSMRAIWQTAKILETLGETDSLIFLSQIMAAVSLHLFVDDLATSSPELIVAANDHSPATVALFSLAREFGIKSCYIQHGPVTESFPPLDYDLSILFNDHAKDMYKEAALRHGKPVSKLSEICVLSAFDQPYVSIRTPLEPLVVCVALSYFFSISKLENLLVQLLKNSRVSKVLISQHPRSKVDLSFLAARNIIILPSGTMAHDIVPDVGLCIVSNSGVALEYLHFGCPTFYSSLEDETPDDYYGFVAAGVMPRFNPDQLDEGIKLIEFFGKSWEKRMKLFDPLIGISIEESRNNAARQVLNLISN